MWPICNSFLHILCKPNGFRPGPPRFAPAPPVSWPPMIFFAKITHNFFDFFAFPNFRKAAKFAASIKRPKTKSASASGGGEAPLTRGPAPGPRWKLCLQTLVIGARYRARHRAPQILRARTATAANIILSHAVVVLPDIYTNLLQNGIKCQSLTIRNRTARPICISDVVGSWQGTRWQLPTHISCSN